MLLQAKTELMVHEINKEVIFKKPTFSINRTGRMEPEVMTVSTSCQACRGKDATELRPVRLSLKLHPIIPMRSGSGL